MECRTEELMKPMYVPMVGIVVTTSPNLSLYKIVVLPAASRPTVKRNKVQMTTKIRTACATLQIYYMCALIFMWFNICSSRGWEAICETVDRALVQWKNMAVHKYKNKKIAKIHDP